MAPGTTSRTLRRLLAAAGVLMAALALAQPASASAADGELRFMRNATSSFDGWVLNSGEAERAWMRDNYFRMRGYPPFFDRALDWAPKTHAYYDAYAIYNAHRGDGLPDLDTLAEHPDWVLRDAQGNPLFIQYACGGGSCTQYAADFGNPEWRDYWTGQVADLVATGYEGIHIDDTNMEMRISDGNGDFVAPIDPRTGAEMTLADWRRYMAEFMEQVRAAIPNAEISHNPIWYVGHDDPYVKRQIDAADWIELERGFNDRGIVGGGGRYGYETYLDHVDWLHNRGKSVIYEPYGLAGDDRAIGFELASYFLVQERQDIMIGDFDADPDDWWAGWDISLGPAQGARYEWNGLIRRDFANGFAVVNQPDAASATITAPAGESWTTPDGEAVQTLQLGARSGAVILSSDAAPGSGEVVTEDGPSSEGPAPGGPADSDGPAPSGSGSTGPAGGQSPGAGTEYPEGSPATDPAGDGSGPDGKAPAGELEAGQGKEPSAHGSSGKPGNSGKAGSAKSAKRRLTLKTNKRRAALDRTTRFKGKTAGAESISIQLKRAGGWSEVGAAKLRRGGRKFVAKLRLTDPGKLKLRAVSEDGSAKPSRRLKLRLS